MIKRWTGDIALLIQAKTGATSALFIWAAVVAIASLTAFVFLCEASYHWLSLQLGAVLAGMVMASDFLVIASIGGAFCAASRRRAKQRAMLARAARAQAPILRLPDPKILGVAMQAGRTLGWQRVLTLALATILTAQLMRAIQQRAAL